MQHPASAEVLLGLPRHPLAARPSSKVRRAAISMLDQAWRIVAGLTAALSAGAGVLVGGASGTAMVLGEQEVAEAGVCVGSCVMH